MCKNQKKYFSQQRTSFTLSNAPNTKKADEKLIGFLIYVVYQIFLLNYRSKVVVLEVSCKFNISSCVSSQLRAS